MAFRGCLGRERDFQPASPRASGVGAHGRVQSSRSRDSSRPPAADLGESGVLGAPDRADPAGSQDSSRLPAADRRGVPRSEQIRSGSRDSSRRPGVDRGEHRSLEGAARPGVLKSRDSLRSAAGDLEESRDLEVLARPEAARLRGSPGSAQGRLEESQDPEPIRPDRGSPATGATAPRCRSPGRGPRRSPAREGGRGRETARPTQPALV